MICLVYINPFKILSSSAQLAFCLKHPTSPERKSRHLQAGILRTALLAPHPMPLSPIKGLAESFHIHFILDREWKHRNGWMDNRKAAKDSSHWPPVGVFPFPVDSGSHCSSCGTTAFLATPEMLRLLQSSD